MHSLAYEINNDDGMSMDFLVRRIAIESSVSVSSLELFTELVPKSLSVIQGFVPSIKSFFDSNNRLYLESDRAKIITKIDQLTLEALGDVSVFIPEGFSGELMLYLWLLVAQGNELYKNSVSTLQDYNRELSIFLSHADARKSQKSLVEQYKKTKALREKYNADIAEFFKNKNSNATRANFISVIHRLQDLKEIFKVEKILSQLHRSVDLKIFIEETTKITGLLNLINTRIKLKEIEGASPQVINNLATGAYEAAKLIEYIAFFNYQVEVALTSVKNTADKLKSVI